MPLIRKSDPDAPPPQQTASSDISMDLRSGSAERRWQAARNVRLTDETHQLVTEALQTETDQRVREALFTALARADNELSAKIALHLVRSDDAGLRTGALDVLRAMPAYVAPHLAGLLRDPDTDVRILSCELVRAQASGEAVRLLSAVIAEDEAANVCGAAVGVLADLAGPEVVPLLEQCASRFPSDPFLAFSVEAATRRVGSQTTGRG